MNGRPPRRTKDQPTGFSTVELVIAVIIIAILVAVAVPVLNQRSRQARIASAEEDLDRLAAAEARVEVDLGYMVRLFALNDTDEYDNGPPYGHPVPVTVPNDPSRISDSIFGENQSAGIGSPYYTVNGMYPQAPLNLFFPRKIGVSVLPNFLSSTEATSLWTQIVANQSNYGAVAPVWRGPFMTWTRDADVPQFKSFYSPAPNQTGHDDIPDDPWGNNYLLFTRDGLLDEPEGVFITTPISFPATQMPDGLAQGGQLYPTNLFDRPTVLSVGPDGAPGDASDLTTTFGQGDDLLRQW
ncbi:MAG: hypothetical protein NTW86_23365 [Candidatus Sumerlaeota bacterium]|nr:hypothetical protein [Candidatus Sumerlaeota bacterium]